MRKPHSTVNESQPTKQQHCQNQVLADRIMKAFNTWSFKREQPSDPALLLQRINSAIAADLPITFVLYWGRGPRPEAAEPELRCLRFLDRMFERIRISYAPGCK